MQLSKLKSGIKRDTQTILDLSSNVVGDFKDETNFSHKWYFTNTQDSRIGKALINDSLANIKLS